jgi:transcriptional regulator with XRE-family HTH domain
MGISTQLKRYRKLSGMTQKEVAKRTGLNEKNISNWERGYVEPDIEMIAIFCRLYDVSPNDMFEWDYIINLNSVTTDEGKIVGMYRELNLNGQEKVADYIHDLLTSGKYSIKDYRLELVEKNA